jgi:hypothetical protein
MVEGMQNDIDVAAMKARVLEESEVSLAELKKEIVDPLSPEQNIDDLIKAKLADFGKFVEKQKLKEIDRSTTL